MRIRKTISAEPKNEIKQKYKRETVDFNQLQILTNFTSIVLIFLNSKGYMCILVSAATRFFRQRSFLMICRGFSLIIYITEKDQIYRFYYLKQHEYVATKDF